MEPCKVKTKSCTSCKIVLLMVLVLNIPSFLVQRTLINVSVNVPELNCRVFLKPVKLRLKITDGRQKETAKTLVQYSNSIHCSVHVAMQGTFHQ